jgi:hypothetical protein
MEAVETFGAFTQATTDEVRPVAKDYYASCVRANSYKPYAKHSACEMERNAAIGIADVAGILNAYGVALEALASDELVDYAADVNAVTEKLKGAGIKGLDAAQVDAVGGLAKLLAKAATSAYQQKQTARFIQESNDAVVKVADGLAAMIELNYVQAIDMEIAAWVDGYRLAEKTSRDRNPLDWNLYSKSQWEQRAILERRMRAARDLAQNIKRIGATHTELNQDASELTGPEVIASVRSFVAEAKPVIREIQDTF